MSLHWLVRKADRRILRPVSQIDLIRMIEAGEYAPDDELCPSKGYWFMLKDVAEVHQHLGQISLKHLSKINPDEEDTSTTMHAADSNRTKIISSFNANQAAKTKGTQNKGNQGTDPKHIQLDRSSEVAVWFRRTIVGLVFLLIGLFALISFWLGRY